MLTPYSMAAEWMSIGVNNYSAFFYDKKTIATVGKTKIVWLTQIMPDSALIKNNGVKELESKLAYHCSSRTFQVLYSISFSPNGSTIAISDKPLPSSEIIPGTQGEQLYELFCRKQSTLKPFPIDNPASAAKKLFEWKATHPE